MAFETKEFLDLEGLKAYTEQILKLFSQKSDIDSINQELSKLKIFSNNLVWRDIEEHKTED